MSSTYSVSEQDFYTGLHHEQAYTVMKESVLTGYSGDDMRILNVAPFGILDYFKARYPVHASRGYRVPFFRANR